MIRNSMAVLFALTTLAAPAPAGAVEHGDKGFVLRSDDDRFRLEIQTRGQFRYAYPWDDNTDEFVDLDRPDQHDFTLNRARLKVGGHAYRKELTYYWEYELENGNLLDLRVMYELSGWANLKVGQWKVQYNRERAISSGKQQMSDRSIVNAPFTLDRQQGVSLFGRIAGGGAADFSYWLSVFSGNGQQTRGNDDDQPLWMGRLQWNPFGRVSRSQGSDTHFTPDPAALIAFAAATNRSPYTEFSQSGGGQLPGFDEDTEPGRYRVNQWVGETAFVMRGFAWQQEFHWKEVTDHGQDERTVLRGGFAQAGYFFHHAWPSVPPPLELAARYAAWDPDTDAADDLHQEYSVALNWFFRHHLNKLTAEVGRFRIEEAGLGTNTATRFRLQWDVSV